jgi:hypothetical protein
VDLHCELVNQSAEPEFGDTQSPTGARQTDNGQVQSQNPSFTPSEEVG